MIFHLELLSALSQPKPGSPQARGLFGFVTYSLATRLSRGQVGRLTSDKMCVLPHRDSVWRP